MNLHNAVARAPLNEAKDDFYFEPVPLADLALQTVRMYGDLDRPVGLAYYRFFYSIWGFSPEPFRVGAMVLLLANLGLFFYVVVRATSSGTAAWLALMVTGVHANMAALYYDTGMIYDVLAFFFYFGVLALYIRIRREGYVPGLWQNVLFAILMVAAVGSKQSVVSLPVAVLGYELLWFRSFRWKALRTAFVLSLVAAFYIAGQVFSNPLLQSHVGYRLQVSPLAYFDHHAAYLTGFLYNQWKLGAWELGGILVGVVAVSLALRNRLLIWASLMAATSFLPIAFIPVRGGYAFVLTAAFWAIWIAGAAAALVEWTFRRWPRVLVWAQVVVLATAGVALGRLHTWVFSFPLAVIHDVPEQNRRHHDQLLAVLPRIPPAAKLLVLNDPYPAGSFDASFLIRLTYRDMWVAVDRVRFPWLAKRQFDPARYDAVLDYRDGHWVAENHHRPTGAAPPSPRSMPK